MKRLTEYTIPETGFAVVPEEKYKRILMDEKPSVEKVYNRLKKIEDILGDEYNLDRLRELAEADREGRCVMLPCKVGDTVYFITGTYNSLVKPAKVEEIYIGDGSIALGVSTDFTTFTLQESEWHLTRAEAEAALKAREQDE